MLPGGYITIRFLGSVTGWRLRLLNATADDAYVQFQLSRLRCYPEDVSLAIPGRLIGSLLFFSSSRRHVSHRTNVVFDAPEIICSFSSGPFDKSL